MRCLAIHLFYLSALHGFNINTITVFCQKRKSFFVFFLKFLGNTTDILTVETEKENRFVLEQLWSLGFIHHTVWLGLRLSNDSKDPWWLFLWDIDSPLKPTLIQIWPFPFSWVCELGGWLTCGIQQLARQVSKHQAAACGLLRHHEGCRRRVAAVAVQPAARLRLQNCGVK